jgi:hypothetical protein
MDKQLAAGLEVKVTGVNADALLAGTTNPQRCGLGPLPDDISEKDFQAKVRQYAHKRGWECYHTHDSRKSDPGFPDCVFARDFGPVRLIVAELKVPPGKPSAAQRKWLKLFEGAGVPAYLWYPHDWNELVKVLT